MSVRAVHWHEGMFLRPHHFQAAQRHALHLSQESAKWDLHYNWGLRQVTLDLDALANYHLVVRSVRARLRDGTLVSVPEDGALPGLDLKNAFAGGGDLTVFLGVPVARVGKANVSHNGTADGARFVVDTQDLEDENTGVNPQPVQVRLLNLKLLLSTQDHAGYEVLPVARVRRADRAESTPELDTVYIPPVLACDAWEPLKAGILQRLYERIGQRINALAGQVVSRGITFDSQSQGDALIVAQLRVLNEVYASLGILAFAEGVHPFWAYLELCRLVGQLAVFGPERRTPELPRYDHDDLGGCFYRVLRLIDLLLVGVREPDYKEVPFIGTGRQMQVHLETAWLQETAWQMFVGVQSPLETDECIKLLTGRDQLGMKIASSDRVEDVYTRAQRGLIFTYSSHPPRALPSNPGLIYFQVDRGSQKSEWDNVQKSLTLAIRVNENKIEGTIDGQRDFRIKAGPGKSTSLRFTLYVVAQEPGKADQGG